jgi:hypothetical protein
MEGGAARWPSRRVPSLGARLLESSRGPIPVLGRQDAEFWEGQLCELSAAGALSLGDAGDERLQ